MADDEAELQEWWDRLSDDSRDRLKQAVDTYPLDSSATKLLFDTRCPALPVGAKWVTQETQEGYSFGMRSRPEKFIEKQ